MPRHWSPIAPDNPGPKDRGDDVRKIVDEHGGKVEFVGYRQGTRDWYALVDVTSVGNPDAMWRKLGARGRPTVYISSDEM